MASPTVPVADAASSARRRLDGWIISPLWDTACFLAPPLFALIPILWLDPSQFDSAQSLLLMLAVVAAGHHVPGFIRAYSDPELMARYRGRMWLAPPLLIAAALLCEFRNIQGLQLLILVWGVWHVVMQNYGLLRIYGAKKSEPFAGTALLDWLVVFTWIAAVYLNNANWSYRLQWSIYDMGMPFLPTEVFPTLATLSLIAAAGSTLLHILALIRQVKNGQPVSLLKYALLVSNVVFFVVAFSVTNSIVFVAVIVEFLHDLQYYALGWVFQVRLAEKQRERRPLMSLLFLPRPAMLLVYVGGCLFYGVFVSDFGRTFLNAEGVLFKVTRGLLTAATIFHFYSDGFIWKVRQPRVRQYLGIDGEAAALPIGPDAVARRRSLAHLGCYAALLVVLLIAHSQRTSTNLAIAEHLVQEFPQLGAAHHTLGFEYQLRGQHKQAMRELQLANELGVFDPVELRQRLASSYQVFGEFDRAIKSLRESLAMAPDHKRSRVAGQLALLLAECPNPNLRNAVEAVRLAETALPAEGPMRPLFLDILASSYQSAGRTKDAQKTATLALQEARQLGQEQLCQHIAARLDQLARPESSPKSP